MALAAEFKAHGGLVCGLVFSPDGNLLATASYDNNVNLWTVADGKPVRTIAAHKEPVSAIDFSPDGKILVSCSADRLIRLWNPADGVQIRELPGHGDTVNCIRFSRDGKTLISGSRDKTVRIWDVAGKTPPKQLAGHEGTVYVVALAPDGKGRLAEHGHLDRPGDKFCAALHDLMHASSELVKALKQHRCRNKAIQNTLGSLKSMGGATGVVASSCDEGFSSRVT